MDIRSAIVLLLFVVLVFAGCGCGPGVAAADPVLASALRGTAAAGFLPELLEPFVPLFAA
jgi:hypothetical protein